MIRFPPCKTSLDLFKEIRVEKTQATQVDRDDKHAYTLQANQSKRVMQNSRQMQAMVCKQGKLYYSASNWAIQVSSTRQDMSDQESQVAFTTVWEQKSWKDALARNPKSF
jgi:hypothetical protein